MRKRYVFGFLLILGALILIGVLGAPVVAVVGLMVLVSACATAVLATRVVSVPPCTALVVCSRLNGAVIRVVQGPAATFMIPLVEAKGVVIDTGLCSERLEVENVLQHDQQPTALSFTVNVMYQLAPHRLPPERLGELLRTLTDAPSVLVRLWTDYYLRILLATADPVSIHNSGRSRLEHCLKGWLASQLIQLGIEVNALQLIVSPPSGLQQTLGHVEQQRAIAGVQVESLTNALAALAGKADEARSLADLEFATSLGSNSQVLVALDRQPRPNSDRIDRAQRPATEHEQLALWPQVLQYSRSRK